jgi:PAS domain S-box-containing protein
MNHVGGHSMSISTQDKLRVTKGIYLIVMVLIPILAIMLMYNWSNTGIGEAYQQMDNEQRSLREDAAVDIQTDLQKDILFTARYTAASIEPRLVTAIVNDGSEDSAPFKDLKLFFNSIMLFNPMIDDIYLMVRSPDPDYLLFLVSGYNTSDLNGDGTITPDEEMPHINERYYIGDKPQMVRSFSEPCVESTLITDKWGTFLSGYAPIMDDNNSAIAIVGIDYLADRIQVYEGVILSRYDDSVQTLVDYHESVHTKMDIIVVLFVILSIGIGLGLGTFIFNRTENALRKENDFKTRMVGFSEERLRKIIDTSSDGIVTLNVSGTMTSCNSSMYRILNTPVDLIGKNLQDLSDRIPKTVKRIQDCLKKMESCEKVEPYDIQTNSLTGDKRWLNVRCHLLDNIRGSSQEYLFMVTDITDAKTALEKISQSEMKYRAIIENSQEGIYMFDANTGQIVESNQSFLNLSGNSEEKMKTLSVFDVMDRSRNEVRSEIANILNTQNCSIKQCRIIRADGSLVEVESSCSWIHQNDKDLISVVSRDMTQRNDYQKKLIEERKRAELYLDILSHDIGNLHMGIRGFATLCKESDTDPANLKMYIDHIHNMTNRSIHLVENIMLISKMSSRKPEISDIEVDRLIQSCMESVKRSFPMKEIRFDLALEHVRPIKAYPAIESAFYNIIHNAVKYNDKNDQTVQISSRILEGGSVLISIRDHGPGIPVMMRKEIFNRASLNKKQGGLGLSIVKMLVESCGGRVWIEDPPDGEGGTVFNIEMLSYG